MNNENAPIIDWIRDNPLHRSGRALLRHPAPALGDDAKSPQRIRVMERRQWQPMVNQNGTFAPTSVALVGCVAEANETSGDRCGGETNTATAGSKAHRNNGYVLRPQTTAIGPLRAPADALVCEVPF